MCVSAPMDWEGEMLPPHERAPQSRRPPPNLLLLSDDYESEGGGGEERFGLFSFLSISWVLVVVAASISSSPSCISRRREVLRRVEARTQGVQPHPQPQPLPVPFPGPGEIDEGKASANSGVGAHVTCGSVEHRSCHRTTRGSDRSWSYVIRGEHWKWSNVWIHNKGMKKGALTPKTGKSFARVPDLRQRIGQKSTCSWGWAEQKQINILPATSRIWRRFHCFLIFKYNNHWAQNDPPPEVKQLPWHLKITLNNFLSKRMTQESLRRFLNLHSSFIFSLMNLNELLLGIRQVVT